MKKFVAICVVLLFAAPALAADWAFYGSERIGTWYTEKSYPRDSNAYGTNSDAATQWYFQGNSRLGAKVKADAVTGQIELALGQGGDGSDTAVSTRRAYGVWKINDTFSLKIGKDYSPVTDFISNQWFAGDNDLLGEGNFYGRRPAGIQLNIGNFELAALAPSYGGDLNTTATGIVNTAGSTTAIGNADPDSYIPRFEAAYQLKLGAGYIRPFGGIQYYTVKPGASTVLTSDQDVLSWVAGVSTNWNIGAFSVGGQLSYGANEGAVTGWSNGSQNPRAASSPILNGENINNSYTLQALLVTGLKFTDTLRFEWGVGYRGDDPQVSGAHKDEMWATYLQAMVTMAPGVFFCPEVGYYDLMDNVADNSDGYQWYVGAKWQIDF